MGKSSSNDELTIRNQFDRICKLALKGEAADYYRHIAYRQKHEVLFSELSQKELDSIFGVDKYTVENKCFRVLGYDIEVKDTLLIFKDGSMLKDEGIRQILVDKETGVNYLCWNSGLGASITPLLDSEGKVIVTKQI